MSRDAVLAAVLFSSMHCLAQTPGHEYHLEPNVSFTPNQRWVVFRSNMLGPTYTFAVEVEKAK